MALTTVQLQSFENQGIFMFQRIEQNRFYTSPFTHLY